MLRVLATPTFARAIKKVHTKDKLAIDKAIAAVASDSTIGVEKKGDFFVYKFKLNKQEVLLAYQLQPDKSAPEAVLLLSLGSHENFYAGLKR